MNKTEKKEEKIEIYILRQVNTLDKGFKLSYACKVFPALYNSLFESRIIAHLQCTVRIGLSNRCGSPYDHGTSLVFGNSLGLAVPSLTNELCYNTACSLCCTSRPERRRLQWRRHGEQERGI